jgi:hypothetical protein
MNNVIHLIANIVPKYSQDNTYQECELGQIDTMKTFKFKADIKITLND